MSPRKTISLWFLLALICCGGGFAIFFAFYVLPHPHIISAFSDGFVNPFAKGYSVDVILCWVILTSWVIHDRIKYGVRYGWIDLIPGVAKGLALCLFVRSKQMEQK